MLVRLWGTYPERDRRLLDGLVAAGREVGVEVRAEYVDVLESVDRALLEQVLVTPTIDRLEPEPTLRLIALPEDPVALIARLVG